MLDIYVLGAAFALIFLSEMGDKTQIVAISLASRFDHRMVFLAVFSALFLATVVAVLFGSFLFRTVDVLYLRIVSAILFLVFGVWTLLDGEEEIEKKDMGFKQGFLLTFMGEMGDKTQIAVIAMVASFSSPLEVLAGSTAAFALVTLLGVYAGKTAGERIDPVVLRRIGAVVFIVFGVAMLAYVFIPGLPSI